MSGLPLVALVGLCHRAGLPPRLFRKARRAHVRHPDLNRPQALRPEAGPMGAHLFGGRAGGWATR